MSERLQIYKCEVCVNVVEIQHAGKGKLVCCGQPMTLMVENSVDASFEKHVPVIEKEHGGLRVKVGSVPHPMEEDHYIEWIDIEPEGGVCRRYLKPGDSPEATFNAGDASGARAYCNLHGLWRSS